VKTSKLFLKKARKSKAFSQPGTLNAFKCQLMFDLHKRIRRGGGDGWLTET